MANVSSSKRSFPDTLTSYDLLKFFAIATMIIDHIGMYFFPDDMWWRTVGRLSAPVWLFLIGYAQSRDLSSKLWIGAGILSLSSFLVAPAFFPMNILWGIILVRLVIDKVARYALSEKARMVAVLFILALAYIPTTFFFDYGSFCLLMALLGYIMRHREAHATLNKDYVFNATISIFIIYYLGTLLSFEFEQVQQIFIGVGYLGLIFLFYKFRSMEFTQLTQAMPKPIEMIVKFGGRRSLEVYVGHLLLFKVIGYWFGFEGLGLFEWRLY